MISVYFADIVFAIVVLNFSADGTKLTVNILEENLERSNPKLASGVVPLKDFLFLEDFKFLFIILFLIFSTALIIGYAIITIPGPTA